MTTGYDISGKIGRHWTLSKKRKTKLPRGPYKVKPRPPKPDICVFGGIKWEKQVVIFDD